MVINVVLNYSNSCFIMGKNTFILKKKIYVILKHWKNNLWQKDDIEWNKFCIRNIFCYLFMFLFFRVCRQIEGEDIPHMKRHKRHFVRNAHHLWLLLGIELTKVKQWGDTGHVSTADIRHMTSETVETLMSDDIVM